MAEKSGCRGGAKGVWLDRQSGLTVPLVVSMEAERSLEDHVARFPLPCVCRRVIEVFFSFLEAIASRLEAITVKLEVCVFILLAPLASAKRIARRNVRAQLLHAFFGTLPEEFT